jgi:hypothetical protein
MSLANGGGSAQDTPPASLRDNSGCGACRHQNWATGGSPARRPRQPSPLLVASRQAAERQ